MKPQSKSKAIDQAVKHGVSVSAIYMRRLRRFRCKAGLTCDGKKRVNTIHKELHGLKDRTAYHRKFMQKQRRQDREQFKK